MQNLLSFYFLNPKNKTLLNGVRLLLKFNKYGLKLLNIEGSIFYGNFKKLIDKNVGLPLFNKLRAYNIKQNALTYEMRNPD